MTADPVTIARDLIRCRSVTPDDGGALGFLQGLLEQAGFRVHRTIFTEAGTAPIDNLYARIGLAKPNLLFAGHTDVEGGAHPNGQHNEAENLGSDSISHGPRAVAAPRKGSTSAQHRKFLLDLHQELLAVLTLLERE